MSWLLLPLLFVLAASGKRGPSAPNPPAPSSSAATPSVSLRGTARAPMPDVDDRELRAVLAAVAKHHAEVES